MLIHIAIVEDDPSYRTQLQESLSRYEKEHDILFHIETFENGAEFTFHYHSGFDLLLMDIEMPVMNGMDAARAIRKVDREVSIIFITNLANYAVQGYEVEALDFIVKPFTYEVFQFRLERVLSRIRHRKSSHSLVLNSKDEVYRIDASDLLYVEVDHHTLIYHTTTTAISLRGSMKQAEAELKPLGFCKCSQSFLVNLRHITRVEAEDVWLGSVPIHISRGTRKDLIRALTEYTMNSELASMVKK